MEGTGTTHKTPILDVTLTPEFDSSGVAYGLSVHTIVDHADLKESSQKTLCYITTELAKIPLVWYDKLASSAFS